MSYMNALEYITHNSSVKIFPSVFWRRRNDIVGMLERRDVFKLTVLVLRRDVEAAWDSWKRAEESGKWNGSGREGNQTFNASLYGYFVESRKRYDEGVETLLDGLGVMYDVFDYDEVRKRPYIVAERNGCYVRNCNFGVSEYRVAEAGDGR